MKETDIYQPKQPEKTAPLMTAETAEKVLRDFIENLVPEKEVKLQEWIKKRLNNEYHPQYLISIKEMAACELEPNSIREQALTTVWVFEFNHYSEIPDEAKGYNKTVFLRNAITLSEENNLVGQTVKQELREKITIEEAKERLLNKPKKVSKNERDPLLITQLAFIRLDKEPEKAQAILNRWMKRLTDLKNLTECLRTLQPNPQFMNYMLEQLAAKNEPVIAKILAWFEKMPEYFDMGFVKRLHRIPFFQQHQQKIEGRQIQEETKKKEEQEKKRQQFIEDQKTANNRIIDYYYNLITDSTLQTFILNNLNKNDKIVHQSNANPLTYFIRPPEDCIVIKGHPFYQVKIDIDSLLSTPYADEQKKAILTSIWKQQEKPILHQINQQYEKQIDAFTQELAQKFNLDTGDDKVAAGLRDSLDLTLKEISQTLAKAEKQKANPVYIKALSKAIESLTKQKPILEEQFQKLLQKKAEEDAKATEEARLRQQAEKETEKQTLLEELKKERLLKRIEDDTLYLKKLYELQTGLNLAEVDAKAADEDGVSIGSVTIGMKQSLRQVLTQTVKLELRKYDEITLEMGESLAEILKRHNMTNWVVPHEVGHMVDWVLENITKKVLADKQTAIKNVAPLWPEDTQHIKDTDNLPENALKSACEESMIDGIGFQLVYKYGTNKIEANQQQRLADVVEGFNTTMEVFLAIVDQEATNTEWRCRYQLIILRMLACNRELQKKINQEEAMNLDLTQTFKLNEQFYKLNHQTNFINEDQKETIINLCQEFFQEGEKLHL